MTHWFSSTTRSTSRSCRPGAEIATAPAASVSGAPLPQRRSPAERRRSRRRATLKKYGTVALFLSPWIIGFLCFTLYPMLASLYYSFTRFDLISNPQWVGLQNYRDLFTTDPYF